MRYSYDTITDAIAATMASTQNTSVTSSTSSTCVTIYELWVVMLEDYDNKIYFCANSFPDISDAYARYQVLLRDLGKSLSVIKLVKDDCSRNDRENARLLDSVSMRGNVVPKSLEAILKDLETPESDSVKEQMLASVRENDKKLAGYNPDTEVKRAKLSDLLRNIKDTKTKKGRSDRSDGYDTADSDVDSDSASDDDDGDVLEIMDDIRNMCDKDFQWLFDKITEESYKREASLGLY
jgi:hypothetical protein